jgi:alpha-L-fucosidase
MKPLSIPGIRSAGKVSLLGSTVPVKSGASGKLVIQPPLVNPGNMPCQHAWVFKVENYTE